MRKANFAIKTGKERQKRDKIKSNDTEYCVVKQKDRRKRFTKSTSRALAMTLKGVTALNKLEPFGLKSKKSQVVNKIRHESFFVIF